MSVLEPSSVLDPSPHVHARPSEGHALSAAARSTGQRGAARRGGTGCCAGLDPGAIKMPAPSARANAVAAKE
jgi:hypothetical protein